MVPWGDISAGGLIVLKDITISVVNPLGDIIADRLVVLEDITIPVVNA
jgi:hypothetical protein